jgi:hypothetical protein
MDVGRLLALIKKSYPSDIGTPLMERVCSSGLLSQFLSHHISNGGSDPRVATASSFSRDGVPLVKEQKCETSNRGGVQPWMMYANERRAQDVANGCNMTAGDHRAAKQEHADCYRSLSKAEQQPYIDKARQARATRDDHADSVASSDAVLHRSGLASLSSSTLPLDSDVFVDTIHAHTQSSTPLDGDFSFRSWGAHSRDRFNEHLFVKDLGDIPTGMQLKVRLSCCQAHPGLCKHIDGSCLAFYVEAGTALREYCFAHHLEHAWVRIYIADRDRIAVPLPGASAIHWVGHLRG